MQIFMFKVFWSFPISYWHGVDRWERVEFLSRLVAKDNGLSSPYVLVGPWLNNHAKNSLLS